MPLYPGDPLTPGTGATHDAKRLTRETAATVLKIPVLPISYADAQHFLGAMDGQVAPPSWRGALPITYHAGPGGPPVHLAVKSEWGLKPIYDVIATMRGAELPDQWVIRGNHHDGWVFGASDPLSGQVALLAEAQAIGAMVKQGFRPKRTLVYASWDAEEPMLVGSTEWAETHAGELKAHALIYINSDGEWARAARRRRQPRFPASGERGRVRRDRSGDQRAGCHTLARQPSRSRGGARRITPRGGRREDCGGAWPRHPRRRARFGIGFLGVPAASWAGGARFRFRRRGRDGRGLSLRLRHVRASQPVRGPRFRL